MNARRADILNIKKDDIKNGKEEEIVIIERAEAAFISNCLYKDHYQSGLNCLSIGRKIGK